MSSSKTSTLNIGRKIERMRTIKGMKQDVLAELLGISQVAVSKMEHSKTLSDDKLGLVAKALGVTSDDIKNFNEDAFISFITNITNANDHSIAVFYNSTLNPIDKLVEVYGENKKLYERLLESERKKNEMLEILLEKMGNKA